MTFRASVLTLYPEMFPGPLGTSLAGKALEQGLWSLDTVHIRDFASDKPRPCAGNRSYIHHVYTGARRDQ